jgi:hypothetical protein
MVVKEQPQVTLAERSWRYKENGYLFDTKWINIIKKNLKFQI